MKMISAPRTHSVRVFLFILATSVISYVFLEWEVFESRDSVLVAVTVLFLVPGMLISIQIAALARWFGFAVGGGALTNPWPEGIWFDISTVITAALFWTLILLALRAFVVRAYEVLK